MARFLCIDMHRPRREAEQQRQTKQRDRGYDSEGFVIANKRIKRLHGTDGGSSSTLVPEASNSTAYDARYSSFTLQGSPGDVTLRTVTTHMTLIQRQLRGIDHTLQGIETSLKEKDGGGEERRVHRDWQLVATTVDRIFFLLFVVAIVVSLATLFPRPYGW